MNKEMDTLDILRSRAWFEAQREADGMVINADTLYAQKLAVLGDRKSRKLADKILKRQFGSRKEDDWE